MATLVLQAAGSALGAAVAGPIGGAIGQALGGVAGALVDSAWLGGDGGARRIVHGPRLKALDGIAASEGAPIPRIYGRVRLGGQIIWATRFEEQVEFQRQGRAGGKAMRSRAPVAISANYSYFANLAVALCEGPVSMVRRVWADGKPLDLNTVAMRLYHGHENQQPDPLISAKQGSAPAYRGTAYLVFERFPLAAFGNRLPQFTFEVVRVVGGLAQKIRAVDLIPGSTEFGYSTDPVTQAGEFGATSPENRAQLHHATDMAAALDALQSCCPNVRSVALVASWFGDDLRVGQCSIRPKVDSATKQTHGGTWSVAGLNRAGAGVVSQHEGRAAYGGTPSDEVLLQAIAALKARGLSVVLYPFVMMDVPHANALADPWTGAASQPAYPWRGRITCHPAPGRPGTVDATPAAAAQVAAFFGTAGAADFAISGATITYTGPDEWSYRRMVLHQAALAVAAGGVDAFIIGSELVGITRIRSASGVYPATAALKALAADVRTILGPGVKIGYAADWTEYGAHVLAGGAEVRFPLDPLWSDANIDFVGIDYYPPIADWRDGTGHADAAEFTSGSGVEYLKDRLTAGEAFDWYYASPADRAAQTRTPITDGAYSKPWTYRAKDLKGWWQNPHVERVGGVEIAATGWLPAGKPIWLTEIGCPAVDKGANSPNLFPDPKSSESGAPPFSSGGRDDLIQARALEAIIDRFDPAAPGFVATDNPASPIYGGRMIDAARTHVWSWDARPYPAFPHAAIFGDGPNWTAGHWITGRIEGMPVDRLIAQVCADFGLPAPDFDAADGFVDGYIIDRPMSVRAALEPVESLFCLDSAVRQGGLVFAGRGRQPEIAITRDDLVPDRKGTEATLVRAQASELPYAVAVGFTDAESDYRRAAVSALRATVESRREHASETTAVLRRSEAQRLADILLQDLWVARDRAEFSLRPGLISVEPGDIVVLEGTAGFSRYQITRIADGDVRRCEARAIEPAVFESRPARTTLATWPMPSSPGPAAVRVLDLPVDPGEPTPLALLALRAEPWHGPYTLWRAAGGGYEPVAEIGRPAILGETLTTLPPGPLWRRDRANALTLKLAGGALASVTDAEALAGANTMAVQGADGAWEILFFTNVALDAPGVWTVSRLIRGLHGSEAAATRTVPAGAPLVVLDASLTPLFSGAGEAGTSASFRISPAGRDHADHAAASFSATAGLAALRPLRPVHVRARRTPAGITVSWLRRTRRGGDNWDAYDVPLAEETEAWRLDVRDGGGTVLRRIETTLSSALYAAADELADLGAEQSVLSVAICQISRSAGDGAPFAGTIPVL